VQLLSHAEDDGVVVVPDNNQERTPLLSANANNPVLRHLYSAPAAATHIATRNGVLDSFPSSPVPSHSQLPPYTSYTSGRSASPSPSETDSEMEDGRYLPSTLAPLEPPRPSLLRTVLATLSSFMTPPLYAALASLVVACVAPLQHFLDVHARPIKGAVNSAGACSIPITLVVLGAYFYVPREQQRQETPGRYGRAGRRAAAETTSGELRTRASFLSLKNLREVFRRPRAPSPSQGEADADAGETKTVVISIVARMIITPLVLVPLMALCKKWDIQSIFDE
jgi:auxin efflux carrier family protein